MLNKIKDFFKNIFSEITYQESLESYIISKNPQTVYDVDHWTKQYDRRFIRKEI